MPVLMALHMEIAAWSHNLTDALETDTILAVNPVALQVRQM